MARRLTRAGAQRKAARLRSRRRVAFTVRRDRFGRFNRRGKTFGVVSYTKKRKIGRPRAKKEKKPEEIVEFGGAFDSP